MNGLAYPLPESLSKLSWDDLTPEVLESVRLHFLGPWLQDRRHAHTSVGAAVSGMTAYRDYTPAERRLANLVCNWIDENGDREAKVMPGDPPLMVEWLEMTPEQRHAALRPDAVFDLSLPLPHPSRGRPLAFPQS